MQGYLSLVLHAHLPFVRHPEHDRFLEENWLFEAITETYIPLIQMMDGWLRDGMETRLTLTLTPTLCSMLLDPLLRDRYQRHLEGLIVLAEKEIHRTHWDRAYHQLAWMYHNRFSGALATWLSSAATWWGRSGSSRNRASWKSSPARRRTRCCRCWPAIRRRCGRRFWWRGTITGNVSGATRGASGCRNARTRAGRGDFFAGGEHPLVRDRHARDCCTRVRARGMVSSRRSSRRTASPRSGATWTRRGRCGASTRVIRAT